jgi:hypothetical protein
MYRTPGLADVIPIAQAAAADTARRMAMLGMSHSGSLSQQKMPRSLRFRHANDNTVDGGLWGWI